MNKKIVFTGGGTAGHVTPNIALLPYLEKEGYAALVRGFERLLDTRFSGETLTIRRGLSRQVEAIRFWASREMPLVLLEQPCR